MTDAEESIKKKRKTAVLVGFVGGLWIGLLGRLLLAQEGVAWSELGLYAMGGALLFAALGWRFPRVITLLLYPFSLFGIGS